MNNGIRGKGLHGRSGTEEHQVIPFQDSGSERLYSSIRFLITKLLQGNQRANLEL